MSRILLGWIVASLFACGVAITAASTWRRTTPSEENLIPVLFVCRETGTMFLTRDPAVPQLHPDTGKATLWPGLYCTTCERWTPSPPMDRSYGKPDMLNCPKCRTLRSFEGEIPDDVSEL